LQRATAMFESWRGRYDDSPRAISERLRETRHDLRQAWVLDDGVAAPDGSMRVRRHSPDYFRRLWTTRYLICNDMIPRHYVKGPRVRYLQTWHGTPLKKIGFDVAGARYGGASAYHRRLRRDIAAWDFLVSPSPFATEIFRQAFDYEGVVIESGYPRNDVLSSPAAPAIRAQVRSALGAADDTRVVLYAPTWRDDAVDADGRPAPALALDLDELARVLGRSTLVLLRLHRLVRQRLTLPAGGMVRDVSDFPDISGLYLASDVLVTDYSSAMFDFAVTGRPMIFFAYDLEAYRDDVRGLYVDLEALAPGPVVRTTGEVAAALAEAGAVATHAEAYRAFVERFCPLDDGGATDRVISAVFES
jgi:CDP-glycerol glycerophosphotransferase